MKLYNRVNIAWDTAFLAVSSQDGDEHIEILKILIATEKITQHHEYGFCCINNMNMMQYLVDKYI